MMLAFVLIAGSLAAGAAVLLLLPLMRQRADARPAAGLAAGGVLIVLLLGGGGLYAAFSNYSWVEMPDVADTPAAMAAKLAKRLAAEPNDLEGWLHARPHLQRRSSSSRSRCAPISAPIGSPMARTPRPSSAWPNRCWRRISSRFAAPRATCSSARW